MNTLTPFGKEVRKLRIDHGTKLKDLAEHLKVSSAYLSAVETGKKDLTEHVIEGVVKFFRLDRIDAMRLRSVADKSRHAVRIELKGVREPDRELAAVFARRFEDGTINASTAEKIMKLLKEGG